MGLVSGIVVFVVVWWVVLFAVLPWGAKPPDSVEPGLAESAPESPRIALKFLVTTGVAFLVWLAIEVVISSGIVSFRDMARDQEAPAAERNSPSR